MRLLLACAVLSLALAGCSLLYNPNNLPAPSDAEIVIDADPTMLMIDGVEPSKIYEGQGDFGSPRALVVLHGRNIIDNQTTVEITTQDGSSQHLVVGTPAMPIAAISANGNWIALQITAPVDPALKQGASVVFDVKVTETAPPKLGGKTYSSMLMGALTLVGLDELDAAPGPQVDIDTATLVVDPYAYSRVNLASVQTVKFIGTKRAVIHSMSEIKAPAITANGAAGSGSTGGAAAVGGCSGGDPGASGGCSQINGMAGSQAGAGGGGGFALDGASATGNGAGAGGARTGDEWIVNYDPFGSHTRNQAGGGGGGAGLMGGPGGAGGGSIELTADGDISVESITANGGPGGSGTLAGGGGGGAGGLVMLRAGGGLAVSGSISVKGGDGNGSGGAGAPGRVRWDAPSGTAPTVDNGGKPSGTLHRGPAFTLTTPIFQTSKAVIPLIGTPNDRFNVYTIHAGTLQQQQVVSFSPDGKATIMQTLQQGYTHLCITLQDGQQGSPVADKCIDVAFLP